jgi:hypothetical protein
MRSADGTQILQITLVKGFLQGPYAIPASLGGEKLVKA